MGNAPRHHEDMLNRMVVTVRLRLDTALVQVFPSGNGFAELGWQEHLASVS